MHPPDADPDVCVRLVLAVSLDGRIAPPDGGAAQLGGPGDRQVLEQALAWADATLIGAGTLRAHQCTCLIREQALLDQRRRQGRSLQPEAVVVSRSGGFQPDWRFFSQPLKRWLLSPHPVARAGFDGWIEQGETWSASLQTMVRRNLKRIVLLGGARLAASLLAADQVDVLQLTLTPRLLGGGHGWMPLMAGGDGLPAELASADAWSLEEATPLVGDEVLVTYRRRRSA